MADKTFIAAASFLTPGVYDDPVFFELMIHVCDIQFASRSTASSASYGHRTIDFDSPLTVYTNIRCLLQDTSENFVQTTGRQGEVIADKILFVPRRWIPPSMVEHVAVALHQVINIRTLAGELINPGPFDIQDINEAGGVLHHYEIALRRVG